MTQDKMQHMLDAASDGFNKKEEGMKEVTAANEGTRAEHRAYAESLETRFQAAEARIQEQLTPKEDLRAYAEGLEVTLRAAEAQLRNEDGRFKEQLPGRLAELENKLVAAFGGSQRTTSELANKVREQDEKLEALNSDLGVCRTITGGHTAILDHLTAEVKMQ